jgi:hypothetical protein
MLRIQRARLRDFARGTTGLHFRQSEIQDFGVTTRSDEDVGRFDVAVNDAFAVGGVERVGDLDGDREKRLGAEWTAGDAVPQRGAFEEFHGDEGLLAGVADLVDGADVGMVQCGGGSGFALEPFEGLRVLGQCVGEKFQGYEAA